MYSTPVKKILYCLAMWGLSWTTTDVWKDSSYKLWKDHMVISLYLSTFSYISPRFSFFTLNWLLSLLWFTTFIEPAVSKIKVPYIVNGGVDLVRVHKDLGCYSLKERFILFVQMLLQPVIIPGRLLTFCRSYAQGSYIVLNSWESIEICPAIFQTWKKSGEWRQSLEKWWKVLSLFS